MLLAWLTELKFSVRCLFFIPTTVHAEIVIFFISDVLAPHKEFSSEKWFVSMENVLKIFSNAINSTVKLEEPLPMNLNLLKVEGMFFDGFLQMKLRGALHTFMTISHSSVWTKDVMELLFLSRVVSEGGL